MRTSFNHGWEFCRVPNDTPLAEVPAEAWQAVSLPHDWLIARADRLYEDGDGLYRRVFSASPEEADSAWVLHFDGVYMDCEAFLNGVSVGVHRYGYTAFDLPLTGHVQPGENLFLLRVRHRSPNSRWYSGAGIFRDVTLGVHGGGYLVNDGVYWTAAREGAAWNCEASAEAERAEGQTVAFTLLDSRGQAVVRAEAPVENGTARAAWQVRSPRKWSPEEPCCYTLSVQLGDDVLTRRVGFREVVMDPAEGLFLNGEKVKLRGVCLHHDLGLFGAAFHPKAARRQLEVMKAMGVNALRTSHNPPAAALLDLCDELGILVDDEFTDMWRRPKTPFDYARFFDDCMEADAASWVRRDRCHPSVILWSVGNEIYDTFADPEAVDITRHLRDLTRRHDPRGNALATIGSNYMPWEGAQKCADVLKIAGYNYGEKCYPAHHAAHPDWVIYGSETASFLASRGVYHFPLATNILSEEDLQCSALGNSSTSWGGKSISHLLADDLNNPYSMGQFLWSGIDYIGEPTPYHTRNCYFGQADTACFPKDSYYRFQAAWTTAPMVHIGVSWDWNPGQLIDVPVMTNCPRVELFLNGVSQGEQAVDQRDPEKALALWRLPFRPGVLQARALDSDGKVKAQDLRCTSGEPARLTLACEEKTLQADGRDVVFLTVGAVDGQGLPVENANSRVWIRVTGPAHLIGLDNGDSADPDGYRQDSRCLFSGKLLAVVGLAREPGEVTVTAEAPGLAPARLTLAALPAEEVFPSVPPVIQAIPLKAEPLVRRIDLAPLGDPHLCPDRPSVDYAVSVLPADAAGEKIAFRVVNELGIPSPCATLEEIPGGVRVTGCGDGAAYLRATVTNGAAHPRIISQTELSVSGFGAPNLDPYGFVTAGLYDLSWGDIGSGNDRGISFAREEESMVGFTHVDFGPVGSDEITLPIFALSGDPVELKLWLGDPRQGGEFVAALRYEKPSIWNTYQPETWKLPRRITGLQTLCFSLDRKVHLQGFSFTRQSRAFLPLSALDADEIYGDDFRRTERGVEGIGNNVTLLFRAMDFGPGGPARLVLHGATPLEKCAVNLRITDAQGEDSTQMLPFAGPDSGEQAFPVTVPAGMCTVAFVFLPGAQFDFFGFRFEREVE